MYLVESKTGVRTLVKNYPTDLSDVLFVAPFIDGCDSLEHFWAQSIVNELDRIKKETLDDYVDKAMEMLSFCMTGQKAFWEEYQYEDPERPLNYYDYDGTTDSEIVGEFLGWGHVDSKAKSALFNYGVDCIADVYKDSLEDLEDELKRHPNLLKLCKERMKFLDI